ncbi:hypothetical protein ATANTOWER_013522 [Ataeniobius toweri]|uniref:Uncharacterized protein n=1 Tax=Ataeniobius toweri TaxID=208326 RepID=A0ABU7APG0_9TELE|nr:hypothetical protein [Ataeniobius toweri]
MPRFGHPNRGISVTCSPSNASTTFLNSSLSITNLSSSSRETSVLNTQTPNPSPPLAVRLRQHIGDLPIPELFPIILV